MAAAPPPSAMCTSPASTAGTVWALWMYSSSASSPYLSKMPASSATQVGACAAVSSLYAILSGTGAGNAPGGRSAGALAAVAPPGAADGADDRSASAGAFGAALQPIVAAIAMMLTTNATNREQEPRECSRAPIVPSPNATAPATGAYAE